MPPGSPVRSPAVRPAPDAPDFGVGVAILAWFGAFLFSNLGAAVLLAVTGYRGTDFDQLPLWVLALLQVPLWIGLVGATVIVSRRWGTGSLVRDYGFRFKTIDLLGLPIGAVTQLVFVPVLYKLLSPFIDPDDVKQVAQSLADRAQGWSVLLLVVLVVVGAPIIEELFFRGLLMRAFQSRFNDTLALVASALLFGLAHFQLVTLPALVMFGLIAGYLAQRTGRLGMSVLAHAGFNAVTVITLLAQR